jgi:GDP-4-dehydro-6-deoxy-D-mannose reductase
MRVFVTGATGFAGSHLVEQLLIEDHDVYVLEHRLSGHIGLPEHPKLKAVEGDLLDPEALRKAIHTARPDVVYHLAGLALTIESWKQPAKTLQVNTLGTVHLLEAIRVYGKPRVVLISSAEIYGTVQPDQLPIDESSIPTPHHPYALSKWAAGQLVPLYWQRYALPVIEVRPFNHIGPRQSLGFVVPDFASQLAAIRLAQRPPTISVGNLSAQRDFTDVRDMVRAYRELAEKGEAGETYIVCSGRAVAIEYLLDTLIELSGIPVEVVPDPARMRPSDTPVLYGSHDKMSAVTGWEPAIPLRQSLADALAEWIRRLDGGPTGRP